jgi:cytochrome c553
MDPLAPPPERGGGNFTFLFEDNLNDSPDDQSGVVPGDAAGHSVVAPGYGLSGDSRFAFAPGGNYPSSQLSCTIFHDPHGNPNFRFLLGMGHVGAAGFGFRDAAPEAMGLNVESGEAESPALHSAYLAGMSDWCGNCHGRYHERGQSGFQHPVDQTLGSDERERYNTYAGDGNLSGGSAATAYLPEVPFEDRSSTVNSRQGPSASSRIICLSCHRAHATSAPGAGRWDFNVEYLDRDGVPSSSYPLPNPYRIPRQRTLCSKCHRPERDEESTLPSDSLLDN